MTVHNLQKTPARSVETARRDAAHFIDGQFTQGATGKGWENFSPLDNSLIGLVPEGGAAEVDAAVRAAKAALDGPWGSMSVAERTDLLAAVADEINRVSMISWPPNGSTLANPTASPRISTFRAARPTSRCSPTP